MQTFKSKKIWAEPFMQVFQISYSRQNQKLTGPGVDPDFSRGGGGLPKLYQIPELYQTTIQAIFLPQFMCRRQIFQKSGQNVPFEAR